MAKKLRIGADTSEFKKSIVDLSNTLQKELKGMDIDIFSKESRNFLKKEAGEQAKKLESQVSKIKEEVNKHASALEKVKKGSEEEYELKKKIFKATKDIVDLEKQRQKVASFQKMPGIGGGGTGGMLGSLLQGKSGMLGMLGKFAGPAAMAGKLLGTGLAATGGLAVTRGFSAQRRFEESIPTRMQLRARGVSDILPEDRERAAAAGLNDLEFMQRRMGALETFGAGGATEEAVVQRAEFERGFGLQEGTLEQMGQQFRPIMGGEQAQKAIFTLQASLIASGITDEIGPYLETAASMLTELNERGFTFDTEATALLSKMAEDTGRVERTAEMITGVDQAIRGATGEQNAFFQDVFAQTGIGEGTIGGIQAAMRSGGLFGLNLEQLGEGISDVDRSAFQELGIGGGPTGANVAGATLQRLDEMFGTRGEIQQGLESEDEAVRDQAALQRMGRLRFMTDMFGVESESKAAEIDKLLTQLQGAGTEEERKDIERKIQDVKRGGTELGNLQMVNESLSGIHDVLKNKIAINQQELGARIDENIAQPILKAAIEFDNGVSNFLRGLGLETRGERVSEALKGESEASTEDFKQELMGTSPKEKKALVDDMFLGISKSIIDIRDAKKEVQETQGANMGAMVTSAANLGAAKKRKAVLEENIQNMASALKTMDPSTLAYTKEKAQSIEKRIESRPKSEQDKELLNAIRSLNAEITSLHNTNKRQAKELERQTQMQKTRGGVSNRGRTQ